jgi:hypothetical protein
MRCGKRSFWATGEGNTIRPVRAVRIAAAVLSLGAASIFTQAAQATLTVGSSLSGPVTNAIGGDITAFPTAPAALLTTSPVTGTVVGGNVKQGPTGAQFWGPTSLRVLHPAAGGLYQVVASGPANPIPAGAGIFPLAANIPIATGDLVAVQGTDDVDATASTGAAYLSGVTSSFPVGGSPGMMTIGSSNLELLYNAQIDPSNAFTVATPVRKNKGRATVVVTVPNPGTVGAGPPNLAVSAAKPRKKKSKPLLGRTSATAANAGEVKLTVTASKVGRKVLRTRGKLKTTAILTYTPTGGSARTQSIKLKLKR